MQKAEEKLVMETKLESQTMTPRRMTGEEMTALMAAALVIQDENPALLTK